MFSTFWTQVFPPRPLFTEKSLPDLQGKVYIVTGSNTGVGKALAQILFSKNARVYIAARSEEKANKAIGEISQANPNSTGELAFLSLDLSDLTVIKSSAESFLAKENKLHVLFNNAGVMAPPKGSKTAQGYELQLGVNDIGHFLFTKLLTPTLISTAKTEPPNTVRVVWVSSLAMEIGAPKSVGVPMDELENLAHNTSARYRNYCISKAGNYLYAAEFAQRHRADGVISVALNPGYLASDLFRHRWLLLQLLMRPMQFPPVFGAYTELFAGLSPDVTDKEPGNWIIPWGRVAPVRKDLVEAIKPETDGGNGTARKFWEWTENQIQPYL
ncbi:short-chain dehydrogenase [Histoplasma ohiense]|nr:short-chain dehydrogenase [Histoplasma ohiense (nom. inval.)]